MNLLLMKSNSHNPYINFAIEDLAFHYMKGGGSSDNSHNNEEKNEAILLYFWINEPSVIIGRNQNPEIECNINLVKHDGIHVVKRKTGGGAVYHDCGNLNFTFIRNEKSDHKNTVCDAVSKFGLKAYPSDRNDLMICGRKFSGFAALSEANMYLQHGTLMLNVNLKNLTKYLTPAKSKLQQHGIRSVEQRVCNISEYIPTITMLDIEESICEQFIATYPNSKLTILDINKEFDMKTIEEHSNLYRVNI